MKRLVFSLFLACLILCAAAAYAGVYEFTPPRSNPADPTTANLNNLEHQYAYQWCFTWKTTEIITGATLSFDDITNWHEPESDSLTVWLLKDKNTSRFCNQNWTLMPASGNTTVYQWCDSESTGKPFNYTKNGLPAWPTLQNPMPKDRIRWLRSDGQWKNYFEDTNGASTTEHVNFVFEAQALADLSAWSADADGTWALGIDPDCHYWNEGAKLTITTMPVPRPPIPEPMSLILGVMGLGSVAGLRRLRGK